MTILARALTCPSCGSPLQLRDGDIAGTCESCGSSVRIRDGIRRLVLPSRIDGTEALRAVRHVLQSRDTKAGAASSARVHKPALYFVPFWHVSAQVSGFALGVMPLWKDEEVPVATTGESQETWSVMNQTRTVRTRSGWRAAKKEVHFLAGVNISGADLEALGIPSLSDRTQLAVTGMEIQRNGLPEGVEVLDLENLGEGILVDPSVPLSGALAQAESVFDRLAEGASRDLEQKWSSTVTVGRRASLVHYPLWVIAFESDNRLFKAVVDGRTGSILSGRFPGRGRDRHVIAAALGFLWAGFAPFLVHWLTFLSGSSRGLQAHCPLAMLAIVAVSATATVKLLEVLDGIERKGSDHVI